LRRTYVVAQRGEYDDRRSNVSHVEGYALMRLNLVVGQLVADEDFIDKELNLFAIQLDKITPPLFEFEKAFCVRIDVGVDLILLTPQPVCRVQVVEVKDEPGPVELAVAQVAGHGG